jgi:biopolymer transport protein ExbD
MAEVNTGDSGGGHGKHQKKRAKKASTRIDMTPMVDLAFLLLTFFVLTSTFSKPKTMEINYPADPPPNFKPPRINNALTFLLSKDNNIYYYAGEFYPKNNKDGKPATSLIKTDYSNDGLRKVLLDANKPTRDKVLELEERVKKKEIADTTFKRMANFEKGKKDALTVLVKADDKASYKNVVDLIDELNITMIGKYAVIDMMPAELSLINAANDPNTAETK